MPDSDARLASDLSLAVMRLARQLRFRNPSSPVSLSQLSALAMLANEGPMTPGALAIRERVRPPSMTRVIASLAEMGLVDRVPHPVDGRQVRISGECAPGFEPVLEAFGLNFRERGELGASVCVYPTGDGYGEAPDGSPFDGTGRGRAWPLLSGERGHYELSAGRDPLPYLRAMAAMTGRCGLIPEQIWDAAPLPERFL